MKVHRFIGDFNLKEKKIVITDKELAHQMARVLKLEEGEKVILADDTGHEAEAVITSCSSKEVSLSLGAMHKNESEPARKVILFQAILKRENFELVAQKAVECGVFKIIPILTERTVKSGLNRERLQKIMHEAAEQSGRAIVPEIGEILSFGEALAMCKSKETVLLDSSGIPFSNFKHTLPFLNCFVGPEGGFTPSEIESAEKAGCQLVSLGSRTLRGETAAIITSYLFANLC